MVDTLALICKVRRGHFLILHPTQKHIQVQSFKFKCPELVLYFAAWSFSLLSYGIMSLWQLQSWQKKKKKKHYMGHGVTSGMSWLICPTRRCQQSVSVCSVCAEQRVNTPTFTSSLAVIISLLSSPRTHVLCLFDVTEVFMVTTHTGGQRGEATSVSVEQDEWDSHTSEKTEKTCKVCCSASSLEGIC